jgi:hypothetical protein
MAVLMCVAIEYYVGFERLNEAFTGANNAFWKQHDPIKSNHL